MSGACPLYPQKRTLLERAGMSALCKKRTLTDRLGKLPEPLQKLFRSLELIVQPDARD